jgi:hypothetical protein
MPLAEAPGGVELQRGGRSEAEHGALVERGKVVFADTCARCHSSKLPDHLEAPGDRRPALDEPGCVGGDYLECWNNYWEWTETEDFKRAMREIVLAEDFLENNYLSTDARIPVSHLRTEICSALAPNAVAGHVWDNFASQSYRDLPAVGEFELWDPVLDQTNTFDTLGGGRGYQRVPSLVSVWSTAPYLHNNEIGVFTGDPTPQGRFDAFDDAIRLMLWPDRRTPYVHRTDRPTDLKVSPRTMPRLLAVGARLLGLVEQDEYLGTGVVAIGKIPKGTPVNLLANANLDRVEPDVGVFELLSLARKIKRSLKQAEGKSEEEAAEIWKRVVPDLIALSNCPDFVVNRGHEFGAELPDADKEALIAFVATF